MHHLHNGLFFRKEADGNVSIIKTVDGKEPVRNADSNNIVFIENIEFLQWKSLVHAMDTIAVPESIQGLNDAVDSLTEFGDALASVGNPDHDTDPNASRITPIDYSKEAIPSDPPKTIDGVPIEEANKIISAEKAKE